MIEELLSFIPKELLSKSGSVFYSGQSAFSNEVDLYILGLNPGGDPVKQASETIHKHIEKILNSDHEHWSEYRDESWEGAAPGTWGLQPRVLHLLSSLGLSPSDVPASNIVFLRSQQESTIKGNMIDIAKTCWPFHQQVIQKLKPRVILCFGKKSAKFTCDMLHAENKVDEFVELNNRKWRSETFINPDGVNVIAATHPGRADWTSQESDPSILVKRALSRK